MRSGWCLSERIKCIFGLLSVVYFFIRDEIVGSNVNISNNGVKGNYIKSVD